MNQLHPLPSILNVESTLPGIDAHKQESNHLQTDPTMI